MTTTTGNVVVDSNTNQSNTVLATYFYHLNSTMPINSMPYFKINCTFKSSLFNLHAPNCILDCGASGVMIAKHHLASKAYCLLEPPPPHLSTVRGVGGDVPILGTFTCTLSTGSINVSPVNIIVVDSEDKMPILIGQTVLRAEGTRSVKFDLDKHKITFITNNGSSSTDFHNNPDKPTFTEFYQAAPAVQMLTAAPTSTTTRAPRGKRSLKEKLKTLKEELEITLPEHADEGELDKFTNMLLENRAAFGTDDEPGRIKGAVANIPTKGEPINIPERRIHPQKREQVQQELAKLERLGIIEKCEKNGGWNSPLCPVVKPNGKIRITTDFKSSVNRRLTQLDPFPLPSIQNLFDRIRPNVKFFSSVDLLQGYFQIELHQADRHKTAFYYNGTNYQYARLPMGLTSAGAVFSREVAHILRDAGLGEDTYQYLDDVSCMSSDFESHFNSVERLLKACVASGIKLKSSKCAFLAKEITFLGRRVSAEGIGLDPKNTEDGAKWMLPPRSKKELLSLQGQMCWLKQFIGTRLHEQVAECSFSNIIEPILATGRGDTFCWTPEADKALDRVKKRLQSPPIISFCDPTQPYLLVTDASQFAAGCILLQIINGRYRVVGLFSKLFDATQRRWSATEREAYAIVLSCEKFDYQLKYASFVVQCDHKALIALDRHHYRNAKLTRWQERLSGYNFCVQYIPGKTNICADFLSRPFVTPDEDKRDDKCLSEFCTLNLNGTPTGVNTLIPSWTNKHLNGPMADNLSRYTIDKSPEANFCATSFLCRVPTPQNNSTLFGRLELADAQRLDTVCKRFRMIMTLPQGQRDARFAKVSNSGDKFELDLYKKREKLWIDPGTELLMIKGDQLAAVVPPAKVAQFLRLAHTRAHVGRDRTLANLKSGAFYWPNMGDDVATFVESCVHCAGQKGRYGRAKPRPGAIDKGTRAFGTLYIDFIDLPEVNGYRYAMTAQCGLTRYLEVYPCKTNSARDTARCLTEFILRHGKPDTLSSDRGLHFKNAVIANMCESTGINQRLHVSWRPEASGSIERAHRTLKTSLFAASLENNTTWLENYKLVVAILNSQPNQSTGRSPFYLAYGREWHGVLPTVADASPDQFETGRELAERLQRIQNAVVAMNRATVNELNVAPGKFEKPLLPGDHVLIHRPVSAAARRVGAKLKWVSGYSVVKSFDQVAKLRNDKTGATDYVSTHHIRHVPKRPRRLEEDSLEILLHESEGAAAPLPILNESDKLNESLHDFFKSKPLPPRKNGAKKPRKSKKTPATSTPEQSTRRTSGREKRAPPRLQVAHGSRQSYD